jgi:hypothetical protein
LVTSNSAESSANAGNVCATTVVRRASAERSVSYTPWLLHAKIGAMMVGLRAQARSQDAFAQDRTAHAVFYRWCSTKDFFARAAILSPNCYMTRINSETVPSFPGALSRLSRFCLWFKVLPLTLCLISGHPDSFVVIILQQIEKSQKNGKIIVCL